MRQLFNWRFVAAVAALGVLALLARAILADDSPLESVVEPELVERSIDLIEPIASAIGSNEFGIDRSGVTTGFLDVTFSGDRLMSIVPGTYGELECDLAEPTQCVIVADMLGDAVVWFATLPLAPRATLELPPILDLEDGDALFESGWRIPYAPVIERRCGDIEIPTFGDFLRDHSDDSVTIVDLATREVIAVRCAGSDDI